MTIKGRSDEQDLLSVTRGLEDINLGNSLRSKLVDTTTDMATMVDSLDGLPTTPPSLYIDIEGVNLSRHGSVSILQLFVLPKGCIYLIDIHTLGAKAFSTPGTNGRTLRDFLESEATPKVFFDVRNDSDALYHHFQINLAGIQDLQLMELATRGFSKKHVNGLSKCIERDAVLSISQSIAWKRVKEQGVKFFAPERGGSYQVFNERPLSEEIRSYCVQDVQFLPQLWVYYNTKLTETWEKRVRDASNDRVNLSQTKGYNGKGQHMALAPEGWAWR